MKKYFRREFLASSSCFLFLGAGCLKSQPVSLQTAPSGPDLSEELSSAELSTVNNSIMAKDFDNYFGKGYSCAESGLMVTLRHLKQPENMLWAARGFGGGMLHHDICGLLTAGIMGIGIHIGTLEMEKKEAKAACGQKVNAYWDWWISVAPFRCAAIREGHEGKKVCSRLGKLASAKLEELFKG